MGRSWTCGREARPRRPDTDGQVRGLDGMEKEGKYGKL